MTAWMWIGVGLAGLLAVSLPVGLATARILGTIGDEIGQLLEAEQWRSAPLTRDTERLAEAPPIGIGAHARDRRSRSSQG
jgi:hypothetical protein